MNISSLFNDTIKQAKIHSPEILSALGVSGLVATSYLTAKAATQVARDEDADPWASNKEKIKRYWKIYIPPAISGVITTACIIGSSQASGRRTAAAVTAFSVTEKAFSEYKEKVVEQVGKNKEQKIRDEIAEANVKKHMPSKEIVIAGTGHVLCCELLTKRYFRSDMEALRKAQNDINARIVNDVYVALDEFYDILGLSYTSASGKLGWNSDKLMELEFSTIMSEGGEPCIAFDYNYIKPL
jgi:hypothetical protein